MSSLREECGLFGIFGAPEAATLIYRGLFSLQHRGQEGAGIVVSDGVKVRSVKGLGLVNEVVARNPIDELHGDRGIGHVRYSTTGSSRIQNVQPLVVECVDGIWSIAHNGNLTNARKLRRMYQEAGAIFQTSTDSEVLVHLLADPLYRTRPQRVARALNELEGAFAFLMMTKDCVMATRDALGFRPLSIGRVGNGWAIASETCALVQVGATYERDVEPGELIVIDANGLHSSIFRDNESGHLAQCVFELVYFARPDSRVFGYNVHNVRCAYGIRLAQEHPVEADLVVPVPDSGNSAAIGFSQRSGLPLNAGFIRNHYVGRTFIMPDVEQRENGADMKLAVLPDVVKDRRVVIVDDSIVRGTTMRKRVALLKKAGAREVHVRISCPPTMYPCVYGIDFPTATELIAGKRDVEAIRLFLGADSLGYLSHDGLLSPFRDRQDFCCACFTGKYPVDPTGMKGKHALENPNLELGLHP